MNYPISVGLDVHKNSISACAYNVLTEEKHERRFGSEVDSLIAWLKQFDEPYRVVYESGFSGFSLKRTLESAGIACEIAATAKIARSDADKIKTDRRDASKLAHLLAAGSLSFVYMPSVEYEGLRDLNRAYVAARDSVCKEKQRISKMLDRYAIYCDSGFDVWSDNYLTWLKRVPLPSAGARLALLHYLDELARLSDEKKRLDGVIKSYCDTDELRLSIDALRCIKGIAHNTAFCLLVEICDFTRFNPPSAFASYLGLTPSEHSSGETTSKSKITKSGNSLVRKALVESAWSPYRAKQAHKKPVEGVPEELVRMAAKANKRLFYKAQTFKAERKKACVGVVACARELSLWVAALAWTCQTGSLELLEDPIR